MSPPRPSGRRSEDKGTSSSLRCGNILLPPARWTLLLKRKHVMLKISARFLKSIDNQQNAERRFPQNGEPSSWNRLALRQLRGEQNVGFPIKSGISNCRKFGRFAPEVSGSVREGNRKTHGHGSLLSCGFLTTLVKIYFDSSPKAQRLRR